MNVSPTILLVDDDPMSVEFMKIFLESHGYSICCAYSLAEAISMLTRQAFFAIITDIQLRDGSGIKLATAARNLLSVDTDITIIGITGFSANEIMRSCPEKTFNSILTKPIDFEHLVQALSLRAGE